MYFKSIIFFCLLLLLNACGIGHYHHLNLVRPDKKTITALVKPKHKTNKVTETFKLDSANIETKEETNLAKTTNKFSEKTVNLGIDFLKKPSQNAKKVKIGLKEKIVLNFLKNKFQKINANRKTNKLNRIQQELYPPYNGEGIGLLIFILVLLLLSMIVGIFVIFENLVLGAWLIGVPLFIISLALFIGDLSDSAKTLSNSLEGILFLAISIIALIAGIVYLFINLTVAIWLLCPLYVIWFLICAF